MKIKNILTAFVLVVLIIFIHEIIFFKIDEKKSFIKFFERYFEYIPVIEKGINLYTQDRIDSLRQDEYFFINEVTAKKGIANLNLSYVKKKYAQDAFKRLLNKKDYVPDIKIEKKNVLNAIGKKFEGNFYSVKNVDSSNDDNFGLWNDVMIKAIYCDKSGFDSSDFYILKLLNDKKGGYLDTHYLFGLLFLKKNKCYAEEEINKQLESVSLDIAKAEDNDKTFSDLYAERIAFLYLAGWGNLVKQEWVDVVKNNFDKEYGWRQENKPEFSGHVSGLSLLSLIYYIEGNNEQPFYDE